MSWRILELSKKPDCTSPHHWTTGIPTEVWLAAGDVLAFFEAKQRMLENGCLAVMAARGALIKPWLFHEWKEQQEWMPTAQERVSIYRSVALYLLRGGPAAVTVFVIVATKCAAEHV